jgi:predicted SAM-dependent methyltransferase
MLRSLLSSIGRPATRTVATSPPPAIAGEALVRQRMQEYRFLHLACGSNVKPGWTNVDLSDAGSVIGWDLTQPLPIDTGYMRLIYCEHFIEHLEPGDAYRLLIDCRRLLETGGVLRISTPDLRKLIEEYLAGRVDTWHDIPWMPATPARLMNEGMRNWGHKFVYDASEFESLLHASGFTKVARMRWGESTISELQGIESRPNHQELIYECGK